VGRRRELPTLDTEPPWWDGARPGAPPRTAHRNTKYSRRGTSDGARIGESRQRERERARRSPQSSIVSPDGLEIRSLRRCQRQWRAAARHPARGTDEVARVSAALEAAAAAREGKVEPKGRDYSIRVESRSAGLCWLPRFVLLRRAAWWCFLSFEVLVILSFYIQREIEKKDRLIDWWMDRTDLSIFFSVLFQLAVLYNVWWLYNW
jgi:hypothetical protein